MMGRYLIGIIFLLLPFIGHPQTKNIKVEASNQPLNVVLLQLRERYDFQFSYSDNELSKYKITVSKTFSSKDEALDYLLKNLPFQIRKSGEVFIIIPDKKKKKEEKRKELTQIIGQIVEAGSIEPLPFSNIIINSHTMVSDVMGSFNYTASSDSSFHLRISHLGYYIYDTILYAGINKQFKLFPSIERIPEVLVHNNLVEKATIVGEKIGKMTINPNISRFLPGQGDNSVFNLLRLMPGIQAAGEQSTDLLIWGSYEGQSLVTFDEFTLFGLKNYNDNISVVNPFLVKNIEILKGGYEAKYGNRVGGIVNITGKNGNTQKPVFSININPTTINGMVEIPFFKKSSLLFAYRQTYYNLYNSNDFNIFAPTHSSKNQQKSVMAKQVDFDLNVFPNDFRFKDMNLKYSYNSDNGDQFFVSVYNGGDFFSLEADANINREKKGKSEMMETIPLSISYINKEENKQRGLSIFYSKTVTDILTSKIIISHSDFTRQLSDVTKSFNTKNNNIYLKDKSSTRNTALENSIKIENLFNLINGHQVEFGGGFYGNEAQINFSTNIRDTLAIDTLNQFRNRRAFVYLQDNLPIGNRFTLKSGLRMNLSTNRFRLHFEPRINASYKLTGQLKLNASLGRYHQFIYKVANVDRDFNYSYLWIASNENIPVLNATHWVGGINYFKNNLTINVESYFKSTRNITQRVFEQRIVKGKTIEGFFPYFGDSRAYGIDIYAKKDFGKHSVWASYTLSKVLERFATLNRPLPAYKLAPQNQLHELKIAALFNIGDFYLSADYVYGSGMEILREVFKDQTNNVSYNRVDAAVTYKFMPKHFSGEVGISVLNLFDTQNLKYANLKSINITPEIGDVRVYSEAVPFTPTLFLKLVF